MMCKLRAVTLLLLGVISSLAWSAPHLALDVSVDPVQRTLNATASITVDTQVLRFQLAHGYVVEAVEVDGATMPTRHDNTDGVQNFHIDLPDIAGPQTVSVRYHGELEPMNTAMSHDDTLTLLPATSSPAGSFLPGSSIWHPVTDAPFTYELTARVPAAFVAVAPGAPADEKTDGSTRSARFVMGTSVDAIDLMIGPWKVRERIAQVDKAEVRIRTYFGDAESALAESYLDAAQRFITRYASEIGPYPYPVFSIVSSPIPTGFGMPTLTYLGKDVLAYPFIRDISLGHEVLHNWWGSAIRVDPARGNWAEGLTTFMADYAYSEDESEEAAMRMRHRWLRDYAALPPGSERPLSAFRTRHHTASATIGYGKSAMMFYALRKRLGAETFRKGIRLFWETHRFSAAGFDQLRNAFEQASAEPLDNFFEQWLESTGAAQIAVNEVRARRNGNKGLAFRLTQDIGPFELDVPLLLVAEKHQEFRTVRLASATQEYKLDLAWPASEILIDPKFEVWRRLAKAEAPPILRDIVAANQVQVLALDATMADGAIEFANEFTDGKVMLVSTSQKSLDTGANNPSAASSPTASNAAPLNTQPSNNARAGIAPMIIAGSHKSITAYLSHQSLGQTPEQLRESAVAIWTFRNGQQQILAVSLSADTKNLPAMQRLGRRLRHLAAYSWIGIAADGALHRGTWPIVSPRIKVRN